MKIKIDIRENDLIGILKGIIIENKKHILISEKLPIGDIIICDENDNELIMIERKALNDLAASIKDGPYNEQSFRLNGHTLHNHNIIYLIEGDLNRYYERGHISKQILQSSMCSILYYKGFSLLRTLHLVETADFIISFADKLEKEGKNKKGYYTYKIDDDYSTISSLNNPIIKINTIPLDNNIESNDDIILINENKIINDIKNDNNDQHYSEVMKIKKEKSANINPENIGEIMLACIPGVSIKTSIEIMKKYKNIRNLTKSLDENPNCLNNIYIPNDKGLRKINKTSIENIKNFLHIHCNI